MLYNQRVNHAIFKKILIICTICALLITLWSPSRAQANVITKPITIAAKHVMKIFTKKNAVNMAEDIVANYLIEDLIGSIDTSALDNGFEAVCLDNPKVKDIEDCPPEKRAQVKKKLTKAEYAQLEGTVDRKIDTMTNTDTRLGKFLDFFVPVFLASGAVAYIESILDSENESIFDELAQESLIESGFLKPLHVLENKELEDISTIANSVDIGYLTPDNQSLELTILFNLKPNVSATLALNDKNNSLQRVISTDRMFLRSSFIADTFSSNTKGKIYKPYFVIIDGSNNNRLGFFETSRITNYEVFVSSLTYPNDYIGTLTNVRNEYLREVQKVISLAETDNQKWELFKTLTAWENTNYDFLGVETIIETTGNEVETDYGTQTAIQKQQEDDGKYKVPGIDSFDFKLPNGDPVVPTQDSPSGFIDASTGEPVPNNVVDNIKVTPKPEILPTPTPAPEPSPPSTDLDQLGKNVPKELIFALLDMLRSILDFMVRLITYVLTIPMTPAIPIPIPMVNWFMNVELLGIQVMSFVRLMSLTAISFGIYRIVKKVF